MFSVLNENPGGAGSAAGKGMASYPQVELVTLYTDFNATG